MDDWYQKELLHFAAEKGELDEVKKLVENGYDINAFDDSISFTPLHFAAMNGHIDVVKYLLSVGADVNANEEEKIGDTPLGAVAASCSYEIAEILVKAGANPTIPGWMQITALDRASARKKEEGRRVYALLVKAIRKNFLR
jgi:ankyrin repeat protein